MVTSKAHAAACAGHPAVFHVTHWKAGSQWVRSVLRHAAPKRFIQPCNDESGPLGGPVVAGAVYAPVYAPHSRFRAAVPETLDQRTFVVIRDPRDTLVSWYFSLLYSHAPISRNVVDSRQELRQLSKSEGLAWLTGKHLMEVAWIQREWIAAGAPVFRYEDFRANQQETYRRLFEFCELPVSALRRRWIVRRHSFIRRTWWRLGRENVRSHLRKGAVGDWRNHFDDDLKRLFKQSHGETLVLAGYERDDDW
jgi:lipopolysaccharide transport system ATP-binding protein